MESQLKCISCQEDFDSENKLPFILPCSHSICKICLNKSYHPTDQPTIQCVSCEKSHTFENQEIPLNTFMMTFL